MTTKRKTTYKAGVGSPYSSTDIQTIGEELETMKDMMGGELKASDVIEFSKDPDSTLYQYFEWDNEKAGKKWRLEQAKRMIRFVYVAIIDDGEPREVRALVSVISHTAKGKRYVGIEDAMSDVDYRQQTVNEALRQVNVWRNKYREYKELAKIFKAIDQS